MVEIEEVQESFLPWICLVTSFEAPRGYGMRFVKEQRISSEKEIDGSTKGEIEVLDFTASVSTIEALLFKRPFIKIKNAEGAVEGKVRFVLDGETIADRDIEGFPIEDRPEDERFPWRSLLNYWATKMDRPDQGEVMTLPRVGLIAVKDCHLQAFVRDVKPSDGRKIVVEAGMIAALYSTKSGD